MNYTEEQVRLLIEASKELSRQHKNVRAAESYPTSNSPATDAVDAIIAIMEQP